MKRGNLHGKSKPPGEVARKDSTSGALARRAPSGFPKVSAEEEEERKQKQKERRVVRESEVLGGAGAMRLCSTAASLCRLSTTHALTAWQRMKLESQKSVEVWLGCWRRSGRTQQRTQLKQKLHYTLHCPAVFLAFSIFCFCSAYLFRALSLMLSLLMLLSLLSLLSFSKCPVPVHFPLC